MTTYILILVLLDALMFGYEPTPKLRHMPIGTQASAPASPISPPCPVDAKKRRLHCPE